MAKKEAKGEFPCKKSQWKKGQSGNPNGQPRKVLSSIMVELKKQGYERVSSTNVMEAFELIMGMDEDGISKMVNDKSSPMILRIVAKRMMNTKEGADMIEKMLDRAHGKAKQSQELTGAGGKDLFDGVSDEDIKKKIEKYRTIRDA